MSDNIATSIHLCSVPISPTNQLTFESTSDQENFFSSKVKFTAENCRFQPRSEKINFNGYVDELQECNYGYYTNNYKGISKTFYFWIVAKNYVAKETTEITIVIDLFQTWIADISYRPCFIEREHVADDTFGKHTILENFELGEYVTHSKKPIDCLQGNPCFFVGLTDASDGVLGGIYGKTYSGFILKYYNYADVEMLNTFITSLCNAGKGDSIAFIFSFPDKLLKNNVTWGIDSGDGLGNCPRVLEASDTFNWSEQDSSFTFRYENYVPRNCKLYCYPFNFITIKNSSGGNVILKLENFEDSANIQFAIQSVLTQHPTITLTPKNYSGKAFAIDDSIQMSDFGLCSWNNDNYSNWFAQHRNSINAQSANAGGAYSAQRNVANNNYGNALSNRDYNSDKGLINTGVSAVKSMGALNFFGGGADAIGGLANNALSYDQDTMNAKNDLTNNNLLNTTNFQNTMRSIVGSVSDAQVQPNTCKGSTQTCGLDMARDTATFFVEQVGIKPEYARIIDNYFQMYGYQVNRVGTFNINSRTRWNYVKTVGCVITGDIPSEDARALEQMHDNGLTFWHDESYMYDYDVDNVIKTNGGE